MKFLVIRSDCGFGDRVITLTTAIAYARVTNRTLVIDWRDYVWCGNNQENDFDYYYEPIHNNYMPLKKFLLYYHQNMSNLTVWPPGAKVQCQPYSTKQNINMDVCGIKKNQDKLYSNDIFVNIIHRKEKDFTEDIVILYQHVTRPIQTLIEFPGLKPTKVIINKINADPFKINVIDKKIPYLCVHLRGADRMNNINSFNNGSYNPEEYIQRVCKDIREDIKDVLVISDTKELVDTFVKLYSHKFRIHQTNNMKSKDKISLHTDKNIKNKVKFNTEMLKDFHFMLLAVFVYSDGVSYFSMSPKIIKMFKMCKSRDEVEKVNQYIRNVGSDVGIASQFRELRQEEMDKFKKNVIKA